MTAKPVTNVRALQLFQETVTPRWLKTLLQILNQYQQLSTAKTATIGIESPLIVPGNSAVEIFDNTSLHYYPLQSEYLTEYQMFERLFDQMKTIPERIFNIDKNIERNC